MVFGIPDDLNAAAEFGHYVPLWHRLSRVVGTFGLDVGMKFADELANIGLGKYDNCIDVGESREDFGALVFGHVRASITLELTDRLIGIYCDDQLPAKFPRGFQISHVADVQNVETAVGKDDFLAGPAPLFNAALELFAGKNFFVHVAQ